MQQASPAAQVCTTSRGRLFITDRITKRQFLVDTGSDLCVHPRRLVPRRMERVDYDLCAANGSTIHKYGWLPLSINLGLRRDFTWRFVVADVTHPIIGINFLSHFGLLVDCRNNRLLDGDTTLSAPAQAASSQVPSVKTITGGTPVDSLLFEFPDLSRPAGVLREVRHSTGHHIRTVPGPPVTCRLRRLAPDRLSPKPTSMPCSGKVRLAAPRVPGHLPYTTYPRRTRLASLRRLESAERPDYSHQLFGCSIISIIALVRAYNQIPIHPDDIQKTAITTPLGRFEFPFMSFGLRNAAQTFQRIPSMQSGLYFCET
jgi:hypothetical protein